MAAHAGQAASSSSLRPHQLTGRWQWGHACKCGVSFEQAGPSSNSLQHCQLTGWWQRGHACKHWESFEQAGPSSSLQPHQQMGRWQWGHACGYQESFDQSTVCPPRVCLSHPTAFLSTSLLALLPHACQVKWWTPQQLGQHSPCAHCAFACPTHRVCSIFPLLATPPPACQVQWRRKAGTHFVPTAQTCRLAPSTESEAQRPRAKPGVPECCPAAD